MPTPRLILHGGAGRAMRDPSRAEHIRAVFQRACASLHEALCAGESAEEVARRGCQLLEDEPTFNAGTGSVLQADGQVRMSAALMTASPGQPPRFSGVVNARRVQHPIALAHALQRDRDRVLDGEGASELARELGLPVYDPVVPRRLREWLRERDESFDADMAAVTAPEKGSGTIGVVALDAAGRLAVGTSTGGRGFERVGRVSDSATPAGNYATEDAAVSCTGIGEDILDECLAARVVVRVTDGMTLRDAMQRSMQESLDRGRVLGAIAIDHRGAICWGKTSDILLAAYHDGQRVRDTLDLERGLVVGATH